MNLIISFSIMLMPCLIIVIFGKYSKSEFSNMKSHISSKELIQIVQKLELENDKNNQSLSSMIEYHQKRHTIKYKI